MCLNREIQPLWSDSTPYITRTFDDAGRVLSENNGLATLSYTYDADGQLLSETTEQTAPPAQPARTVSYTYDAVDQLVIANYATQGSTHQVSYQYDATGNRQWRTDAGTTTNYAVNADNAYTQIGGGIAAIDRNGNHAGTGGSIYVYDAQNRLINER